MGLGAGLLLAVVLGVVVEMGIIRRFRHSPRLVLTVATLGITQLMVVLGLLVPRWWGRNLASERIAPPFDWKLTVGTFILNTNDLIAIVVAPLTIGAVAWFLARSRVGLAVRASAERSERASMLGIPVARINTVVWTLSTVLAFVALFLKSGITGVPLGFAVALSTLLQALAALVIGRLERLPTILTMAVALGLLEAGVQWNSDSPFVVYPIMAGVMFVVLLVQKPGTSRRDNDATSSWRGADEVRPVPPSAGQPLVRFARRALLTTLVAVVLLPLVLWVDCLFQASADLIRDRWDVADGAHRVGRADLAGPDGLGRVGGAVGEVHSRWKVDLSLSMHRWGRRRLAAFVVGLPALRLHGLYLAVTTLAFGLAVQSGC